MLDPRRPLAIGLRYGAYPALVLLVAGSCAHAIAARLPLPDLLPLVFGGVIGATVLLECLIPYEPRWQPTRREVVRDGGYFVIGLAFGGLAQLLVATVALWLATSSNGLPLWLGAPLAVVVSELFTYAFHRRVHRGGFWWKEHGVHHVPTKVNALNTTTGHFLDVTFNNLAALLPLVVLGFSAEAIFIATVARVLQNFVSHANADLRLGWLGHLLMGPEHHRLHHGARRDGAGNYSTVLTLWDRVFGTFTWAPGRRPDAVGVDDPGAFPDPQRILPNLVHPFRSTPRTPTNAG
ncbi:sterol desaturase family protein [Paraliomyxa miuraensis]|uniref:sterol desaturase family protein n=1 Tax=Paraliomyxa miuraensis TaxID=376150 RepID=UPI0022529385|nr:sterol desaturase family protein [Paraliomyxa miuraensis]MCX4242245.1 sterol desaturase family protein [Paraliomyxa miuraensis]